MNKLDYIKAGIFGTVVADALGVPVEFSSRAERKADPVTDMREYGTHNQPKGTWSDDSSMMLGTLDSIGEKGGIDLNDIMSRFSGWKYADAYTPHGSVFDMGVTCSKAIDRYLAGYDPVECGGPEERDNGNGSLMRIMPASLYASFKYDFLLYPQKEAVELISNVSSLTHAHPRSRIGCVLYTVLCYEIINKRERSLEEILNQAVKKVRMYYLMQTKDLAEETEHYLRMSDAEQFKALPESEIKSSGYVVDTLEAAVWCLLNSRSYSECVLKAVNLGGDTDTVGAVAGGLAGLWYGYDDIPKEWLDVIVKKEWIEEMCQSFEKVIA